MTHILQLQGIRKRYHLGTPVETEVLHGIDMALAEADREVSRRPHMRFPSPPPTNNQGSK